MQPQGPYGQNGQSPYPQGPPQGPNPYAQPGQQIQPGQPQPYPGGPPAQGFPAPMPGPAQPQQPQAQLPGQPPMPAYQVPPNRRGPAGQTDNLPPPPSAPSTPYDFFLQPKPHQASMPLPSSGKRINNIPSDGTNVGGATQNNKFIFLAGGAVVVVLFLLIGVALIPKDQTGPQMVSLAQTQQEVIRVCSQGTKAKYQSTRNFAATCSAGVTTNQTELLAYITKQNYDYNPKLIGAKTNAQTTAKLAAAQSSSTFDDVFRDVAKAQLAVYDRSLKVQLAAATGVSAREVLSRSQRSAELLLLLVADDSNKTEASTTSTDASATGTATNP